MFHKEISPYAGRTVRLRPCKPFPAQEFGGSAFTVEDWWDRIAGKSWMFCDGNPACLVYAIRSADNDLPTDDEVLYGKLGGLGALVHISEVDEK